MLRIKQILQLLVEGVSQKQICSYVHCSKLMVSAVNKTAMDTGVTLRNCCRSLIPSSNPSSCRRTLLRRLTPARLKTKSVPAQKWSSFSRVFPTSYSKTSSTYTPSYQRALPSFILLSWEQRFLPTKPLAPVTNIFIILPG